MAGFAAALGGAAQPLLDYGHQMRGILEQRRDLFADLAQKRATEETDPAMRDQWTQAAAGALSGQDFGKILPKLIKAHDTHQASTQALGQIGQQIAGGQPQPAPPPPSTGSGIPGGIQPVATPPDQPGQFTSLLTRGLPAAPVAAQPAGNPIAGPQGPIQAPVAPAPAPTALAVPSAPIAPVTVPMAPIAGPAPTDPRAMRAQIIQDAHAAYQNATPAMRPMVEAEMKSKLDALAPFEQFAQKKAQFEEFSNTPEFKALPPAIQTAYRAQAFSLAPVSLPTGAMVPNKTQSTVASLSPEIRKQFGLESLPDTFPITISKNRLDNSILDVVPGSPQVRVTTDENGNQHYTQAIAGTTAGVAPGTVTGFKSAGVDAQGHPMFVNPFHPSLNFTGAGVNPGFIPSVSNTTTQVPGQLPSTSHVVKTKGGGPIMAITGGNPQTTIPSVPKSPIGGPLVQQNYQDWVDGKRTPTGKDMDAVALYAKMNNLPTPTALSPAGQKIMQVSEATTSDIDSLLDRLTALKSRGKELTADYLKYKYMGQKTPYDDIFTGTAFERLKSAGAALQGMSMRGQKVLAQGLEHTPTFDRLGGFNPDSIGLMIDKLNEAKSLIAKDRDAAVHTLTKTGVIAPITTAPITPLVGSGQSASIEVERGPDGKLKIKGK